MPARALLRVGRGSKPLAPSKVRVGSHRCVTRHLPRQPSFRAARKGWRPSCQLPGDPLRTQRHAYRCDTKDPASYWRHATLPCDFQVLLGRMRDALAEQFPDLISTSPTSSKTVKTGANGVRGGASVLQFGAVGERPKWSPQRRVRFAALHGCGALTHTQKLVRQSYQVYHCEIWVWARKRPRHAEI